MPASCRIALTSESKGRRRLPSPGPGPKRVAEREHVGVGANTDGGTDPRPDCVPPFEDHIAVGRALALQMRSANAGPRPTITT